MSLDLFKETIVSIDGDIKSAGDAHISVFDRGFLYGDSVYEVTYTENKKPLFLKEHLDRLDRSASMISMPSPTREKLIQEIDKIIKRSQSDRLYLRIVLTRGISEIGLDPELPSAPSLIIIAKPLAPYPEKLYEKGISLYISNTTRNSKKSLDPNIKSGNYLNNIIAFKEAKQHGHDDAIMKNNDGHITEGTSFNIWMVSEEGIFKTPCSSNGILEGITRAKIISILEAQKYHFEIGSITEKELLNASEVFITSATKGIVNINRINNQVFKTPGKFTSIIRHHYQQLINDSLS